MSVTLFHRSARRVGPELPQGELQLQEPPSLPEAQGKLSNMLTMAPMALSSVGMMLIFLRPSGGSGDVLMWVAMGIMGLSAVGMLVSQLFRSSADRKRQLRGERRDYLRYLSQIRRQVRRMITEQRTAMAWRHPEPTALWCLVGSDRLWERRPTHDDFGDVRVAVGDQRLMAKIVSPSTKPVEDLEPLCAHALRRFINAYTTVPDQPIAVFLRAYAQVLVDGELVDGEPEPARGLARAMIAQLATFHAPEDVRIAVVCERVNRDRWEWLKWLPHALHQDQTDGAGAMRLIVDSVAELEPLLGDEFGGRPPFEPDAPVSRDEPYVVIFLDNVQLPGSSRVGGTGYRNTTVVDLGQAVDRKPAKYRLHLAVAPDRLEMLTGDRTNQTRTALGRPDLLPPLSSAAFARLLAPYRMGGSAESAEPLASDFELTSLLGITDLNGHDVAQLWRKRTPTDRLRVPLGVSADGQPVELDIKESAQGGMGPHGMLIGATGSGKSELLRTLVLALALMHSSEILNFVLVDFKGGATFLNLDRLPHTSAVITNLADEEALVDRMRDALHGELIRRQELLRRAGNYTSALEYETARLGGAELAPLPTLFVIVDEFSELLAAHRDFMELFIMIGRLGRSLGVHLLLASQRLDEGRMHALESHLSYRIGLRTFSAMESRGVLGVPDAYQLPTAPGNGFLRSDIATLTRFKAAYVSGAYQQTRRHVAQSVVAGQVTPYTSLYVAPREPVAPAEPEPEPVVDSSASLLEVAVERLQDAGPPAHQVWLPPLDVPSTVDQILPPLSVTADRGFCTGDYAGRGALAVPVGIVDKPFQQQRDHLFADLSGAGGHVGIAGGPQSGKSTLLRTLITCLALTHTPREVQFYCLDFGGGTLASLADLPHVGTVTGRLDLERVNRMITEVTTLIAEREKLFADNGIDSMATFRARRAAGTVTDQYGDVFLVVDGWSTIRQDFPDYVQIFSLIAARGLSYGVHLVISTARWGEITTALRDQLGTRFELRLGDPVDSAVNMRAAAKVPKAPGRGMTDDQLHFLTALPRVDGSGRAETLADGVASLVRTVAEHWSGPGAPGVRTLPTTITTADLPAPEGRLKVALGTEELMLSPLWHDFETTPHLMVVGDTESGKTNLVKVVLSAVTRQYTPDAAKVILVDYRRELFEALPDEYRLGYAVSVDTASQLVDGAARAMKSRLPSPDITPARLRQRDWWTGPELFLVIDDYDLVVGMQQNSPFLPLLDYLAQGAELGLHVIVTRSTNGLGRALSDPLLRKLQDVNTPAVLLSCPPSEGVVFGNVKPRQLHVGRGVHISRRRTRQLQTAHLAADKV